MDATLPDEFLLPTDWGIPRRGTTRVASTTLVASAAVSPAPRRSISEQSKQGWLPFRLRFGGPTRVPCMTPEAGAAAVTAPQCGSSRRRVNETGSPSDRGLEPWEGRVAHYGHKKEAKQENPGKKSTISLNTAVLALGTNNLDVHSRDLI